MRIRLSESLPTKGRFKSAFKKIKRNGKEAAFIAIFLSVGIFMLLNSEAASGYDLVVTDVVMSPTVPSAGEEVVFSATVKNNGSVDIASGTVIGVAFEIDGELVAWNRSYTGGLAAGQSTTLSADAGSSGSTWKAVNGAHMLKATADDANLIANEANESNNSLSHAFAVGNTGSIYLQPSNASLNNNDSRVFELRIDPGTTVDGTEATVTFDDAKLQFIGIDYVDSPFNAALSYSASGSTVELARGNLSGGVSSDSLIARLTFKALAGEGGTTINVAGNAAAGGAYTNPSTQNAAITFNTPDLLKPDVTIISPSPYATVWESQLVSMTATDNIGITKVELYVDGQLKGTDETAPYEFDLDTNTLKNGDRRLLAKAYDAAGNIDNSVPVDITVKNWPEDINNDSYVNLLDFSLLATKYGQTGGGLGAEDINRDGAINLLDFSLLATRYGQ